MELTYITKEELEGLPQPTQRQLRMEAICHALIRYFEEEEPYIDPALTARSLAQALGTNTNYLAEAIKRVSGTKFHGFVDGYRFNKALKINHDSNGYITSQELCTQSGFRSTTFYRRFREHTGLTPQQFDWGEGEEGEEG